MSATGKLLGVLVIFTLSFRQVHSYISHYIHSRPDVHLT